MACGNQQTGGKHWQFVGLDDTRHITKIFFHPKNPEIVYCTATGHLFGPNEERGVYKTSNGGLTWKKILFINDEVGAIDMAMDAIDILYVSSWRVNAPLTAWKVGEKEVAFGKHRWG
ncbi:MAG: hypothetical protein IPI22_01900 [Bacteroidetes bacterium]|nr:hypothetical protein [Bacteroidota bacterium]